MKKMRRVLAILLVLAMAMSTLAACGTKTEDKGQSTTTNKTETGKTESGDTGATEVADEWTWPLAETKEVSIWTWWANDYFTDPNELKGIQAIEAATNVHVNWVHVTQAEAVEKFGLMMASGDYPDILRSAESYYTGGLVQACTDGVIIDMTEYVEKYMPTYMALRTSSEKLARDTVTDDGRMVGVYSIASKNGEVSGEKVWDGLCVRQDWLDELGMDQPVTIDDWYEMLKAFKENYNCEAPLLIGATNGYDVMHNFVSAYGVLGGFYNDNGTVKYGPLEDGYRQWVELFRKWYAEGLIDQNFVSNDASFLGSGDYLGTGRAGAGANIWGFTADTYKTMGYTTDEDFFLAGVTPPVLNEGDTAYLGMATSELTKETLSITSNCKDVELACRYLDYWYTEEAMFFDSLGIEGESYVDNGDGTYSLTQAMYDKVTNGDYPQLSATLSEYTLGTADFGLYNWAMFDPLYVGQRTLEAYDPWSAGSFDKLLPPCMTMTEDESIAYNNLYTAIQTLVSENTVKFIMGAQDMSAYDAFVQSLYDYGIEDCIKYQQAALDRYNAR